MRVSVEPWIKPKAAIGRVDVKLLVEDIEAEPVPVEYIDPFAPVDPGPASAVIQRAPRVHEHSRNGEIGDVSGDRVPVRESEVLVVQHLADDSLELIKHEAMPGQEVPLLVMLRVGGIVGVGLTPIPYVLGIFPILWRKCCD